MIDWHNHILPEMDDGSRSIAESISMLDIQTSQGVHTVVATPHFYANDESVNAFLERRNKAHEELLSKSATPSLKIILGAEVRYYQGISRLDELKLLRIEGSKLLLLEMPQSAWTEYMIRELLELSGKSSIKIVLAHVERYLTLQNRNVFERLKDNGVLMQANSSFFTSFVTKRRALSLLDEGSIHFVGSDCHNLTSRAPNLGKAFEVIEKKFGNDFIEQMNGCGYSMLSTNN